MTDEDELLEAICAEPDRDEPRIVYADWLEQQGDPRGEFIHAQCTPGRDIRAGSPATGCTTGSEFSSLPLPSAIALPHGA